MDAIEHLRAMVSRRLLYPGECPDCKNWISFERPDHKPDCPWLAAKAFVQAHDIINSLGCSAEVDRPVGITYNKGK